MHFLNMNLIKNICAYIFYLLCKRMTTKIELIMELYRVRTKCYMSVEKEVEKVRETADLARSIAWKL